MDSNYNFLDVLQMLFNILYFKSRLRFALLLACYYNI